MTLSIPLTRGARAAAQRALLSGTPVLAKLDFHVVDRWSNDLWLTDRVTFTNPREESEPGASVPRTLTIAQDIDAKAATGNLAAQLGAPIGAAVWTADRIGFIKAYEHGWILWRPDRGPLAVYGAIGERWNQLGGTASFLGWPKTDELPAGRSLGRYNDFDGGSIYWGPTTGAHVVYGAIRDRWLRLKPLYDLGLPTTDEFDVVGYSGVRRSIFEAGTITWTPWSGARVTALNLPVNPHTMELGDLVERDVIVRVRIDVTDDDWPDPDDHGHADKTSRRWFSGYRQPGALQLEARADSVSGSVNVRIRVRPDGSVITEISTTLSPFSLSPESWHEEIVGVDDSRTARFTVRTHRDSDDRADVFVSIGNFST